MLFTRYRLSFISVLSNVFRLNYQAVSFILIFSYMWCLPGVPVLYSIGFLRLFIVQKLYIPLLLKIQSLLYGLYAVYVWYFCRIAGDNCTEEDNNYSKRHIRILETSVVIEISEELEDNVHVHKQRTPQTEFRILYYRSFVSVCGGITLYLIQLAYTIPPNLISICWKLIHNTYKVSFDFLAYLINVASASNE